MSASKAPRWVSASMGSVVSAAPFQYKKPPDGRQGVGRNRMGEAVLPLNGGLHRLERPIEKPRMSKGRRL
jgi:hypothetical protein